MLPGGGFLGKRTDRLSRMVWCPESELNRHFPCGKTDFLLTTAFAASTLAVCGLDYAFISVRWLPSSLYTFPLKWAWLGVGISVTC